MIAKVSNAALDRVATLVELNSFCAYGWIASLDTNSSKANQLDSVHIRKIILHQLIQYHFNFLFIQLLDTAVQLLDAQSLITAEKKQSLKNPFFMLMHIFVHLE